MGDIAYIRSYDQEDGIDMRGETELEPEPFSIWVTKDGTEVNITDMTADHLRNSLEAVRSNNISFSGPVRFNWLIAFKNELRKRGK